MKIEKFTKNKNGMYILVLDNGNKIKVHEDLILKYELLLSKKTNEELLEAIQKENQIYEIYEVALKYINTRLRSSKELIEYLKKKGYEYDSINQVLSMLKKQGYLDEAIYASSFVHDKILMSNYGPNKIYSELEKLGIDNNIISDKISIYTKEMECERINKIIEKQIKLNHNKGASLLKRKIQTFLLSLGYTSSYINECISKYNFYDKDVYEKEYQKILTQLSKKYSGKELEYKLKQKLYQKGFSNYDM